MSNFQHIQSCSFNLQFRGRSLDPKGLICAKYERFAVIISEKISVHILFLLFTVSPKCVKLSKPSKLKSRIVRFWKYIHSIYACYLFMYLMMLSVLNQMICAQYHKTIYRLCTGRQSNSEMEKMWMHDYRCSDTFIWGVRKKNKNRKKDNIVAERLQ